MTTVNKNAFERLYRAQRDAMIKERMLLVLNVVYHGKVAAHVAREIHRSKGWTTYWLKRYDEEGIEGLRDREKGGRPTELSVDVEYRIKTILKESNQGWTTKQIEELIIQESGVKYNHNYIYAILHRWGFKQKTHVNTASKKEKKEFKKDQPDSRGCTKPKRRICSSINR